MPIFKTGDGTEDTVLFVTFPLVIPDWFRVALMGALREMTIEDNWFVEGDAPAAFARDKAVEMMNGIEFSEENPLPVYTPPIGEIKLWPTVTPPDGWLKCWGTSLLIADYPDLYAVIVDTFGAVDGDHFSLPDFRTRFPLGGKTNIFGGDYIGATGGLETVTLTEAQIPAHTHENGRGNPGATKSSWTAANTGNYVSYQTSEPTGGGGAHENMPPYLTVNFIIYTGV